MEDFSKEQLIELAMSCESDREEIVAIVEGKDDLKLPEEGIKEEEGKQIESNDMFTIISKMTIPQKFKLALFGNHTARTILIRDTTSKQIPMFVLHNARITESEIYDIARNTNIGDFVLRAIAGNAHYMKSYAVKLAIVSNPKVPIDITLKWVKFLAEKDLKKIAGSKNIPQVLATHCRKMIEDKKKKGQ